MTPHRVELADQPQRPRKVQAMKSFPTFAAAALALVLPLQGNLEVQAVLVGSST